MKLIFAIFASTLMLAASDPQAAKKTTAPAKTIKPLEIPKGAVETEPGTFRYTDSEGKKWIYRKTPWGVARLEDKPEDREAATRVVDPSEGIKAVEDGETVHFERPGPFGVYKWDKNRADLDETERKALQRSRTEAKTKQQ
ncbi:MAG TPA: hypothetical protein VMH28_35040 [Candidatus Acidoferrales bacterium]|nr:hypothetical protein [Bryobacteraceae bacterium]HTS67308.1 hypothetical protein [Candidatus Acidoferrales bacterium]